MKKLLALLLLVPSICFSADFYMPTSMVNYQTPDEKNDLRAKQVAANWKYFFDDLNKNAEKENIIYTSGGPGGSFEYVQKLAQFILKHPEKKFIISVTGTYSGSNHAFILCLFSDIKFTQPRTELVFHAVLDFDTKTGKYTSVDKKITTLLFNLCKINNLTSDKDLADSLSGKNVIFFVNKNGKVISREVEEDDRFNDFKEK